MGVMGLFLKVEEGDKIDLENYTFHRNVENIVEEGRENIKAIVEYTSRDYMMKMKVIKFAYMFIEGRARDAYLSSNLEKCNGGFLILPRRSMKITHQRAVTPRASKSDVPSKFRYPPMDRKPRWWWRTLSSIPYLMPLHQSWVFSETAYHLHPFLEDFEFCTYPFLRAIGSRLPTWFFMAYFFFAYLAVVRRKEWPHFFRFHVMMGMLLEIALQAVGMMWRFLPRSVYWGKIGMHFWAAFTFAYLFTVIECLMCALAGMYADVPFLSDAAYAQIPYD